MYIFRLLKAISGKTGVLGPVEIGYQGCPGLKSCCKFEASNLNEGNMGVWRQLAEYFYIKKRDPKAPHSKWMGYMHGINRISLFMFIIALIIIFVRMIFFRK
jgi:hypothetical protein